MQLSDGSFLFGRVVRTDANCMGPNCYLVYVFRHRSAQPDPPPRLLVRDLLIAPFLINRLGWSRGYLTTIENRAFEEGELLAVNHFRDAILRDRPPDDQFVNEDGQPVPPPPAGQPVGWFGLGNYRSLDDAVSTALAIKLAPSE
jgi:hypothetical protein